MTRLPILAALIFAGIFLAILPTLAQEAMDNEMFPQPSRPPSLFDHDLHTEIADCNVCHHVYENGRLVEDETSEDQQCVECHGLEDGNDNPIGLRRAFHLKCKGCHMTEKAGPVMCAECHPLDQ